MGLFKQIPNFITLLNLLSGVFSIYFGFMGDIQLAGSLIFIAAVFDFLDGFAARLLNAKSEIGLQLDSLADMVSFGVAPGFILLQMMSLSHGLPGNTSDNSSYIPFLAFVVPAFAALRLAIFNTDETQKNVFYGLPTPALALLIASLPLIREVLYDERGLLYMIFTNTYFLLSVAFMGSLLMVARLPMFAFKFSSFKWADNKIKFSFILISIILLFSLKVIAVPFIFLMYLFVSLITYLTDIQDI